MTNDIGEFNAPKEILRRHSLRKILKSELTTAEPRDDQETLTQEDLAPEGGWGWMVALGMTITSVVMYSTVPCFAIMFEDLLESSGSPGSSMTILNMIWTISWSLSGLCANGLLKKFSMRFVGVTGALVFSISWTIAAVVMDVYQLGITFFTQGIGLGIMGTICQSNFNAYFVKRRATVTSATQIIMSLFGVLYPIFIGEMMEIYGFRGAIALTGAVSFHSVFGMLLMHPVEWHLRDPKEVLAERQAHRKLSKEKFAMDDIYKNIEVNQNAPIINETKLSVEPSRWSSLGNLREDSQHHTILTETLKAKVASSSDVALIKDPRSRVNSISRTPVLGLSVLSSPSSSIGNLGVAIAELQLRKKHSLKTPNDIHNEKTVMIEKANLIAANGKVENKEDQGFIETILDLFDLAILKDYNFIIMCLGISFSISSDIIFSSLLPLAMFSDGYTTGDASYAVALSCAAEFVTKIIMTIMTIFVDIRAKLVVFIATLAMVVAKFAYFNVGSTFMGIMVSMVLIGIVRVFLYVPQSLVIVENYPVDKYAACYGIFSMINGLTFVVANPIFGIIKDLTDSFSVCQLALIAMNCVFIPQWGIELVSYYRNKRRQKNINFIN